MALLLKPNQSKPAIRVCHIEMANWNWNNKEKQDMIEKWYKSRPIFAAKCIRKRLLLRSEKVKMSDIGGKY